MATTRALAGILLAIALAVGVRPAAPAEAQGPPAVAEDEFDVTLGDGWVSKARISYPADRPGPFPTVVLTYPLDMDFTVPPDVGFGPGVQYFRDLAASLSGRGIAVVRYNSRYVTSATEQDEKAGAVPPLEFASDIERVLAVVRANPRVAADRVFLYGWSASSAPVALVGGRDARLAGIILQGATASTRREDIIADYTEIGLAYVRQFAVGGQITADSLSQAAAGPATFAKFLAGDFQDVASQDVVKVSPILDTNGDGALDPDGEIVPNLGALVDADPAGLIAQLRTIPDVESLGAQVRIPVLVLQGEADTAVRAAPVRRMQSAFASRDYTARFYPGLGHALAPLPGPFEDLLLPMADQPKADFADWVLARGAPASLPRTGGDPELALLAASALALGAIGVGGLLRRREQLRR